MGIDVASQSGSTCEGVIAEHLVGEFVCKFCGIVKNTKQKLAAKIGNLHAVNHEARLYVGADDMCSICLKMYRTRHRRVTHLRRPGKPASKCLIALQQFEPFYEIYQTAELDKKAVEKKTGDAKEGLWLQDALALDACVGPRLYVPGVVLDSGNGSVEVQPDLSVSSVSTGVNPLVGRGVGCDEYPYATVVQFLEGRLGQDDLASQGELLDSQFQELLANYSHDAAVATVKRYYDGIADKCCEIWCGPDFQTTVTNNVEAWLCTAVAVVDPYAVPVGPAVVPAAVAANLLLPDAGSRQARRMPPEIERQCDQELSKYQRLAVSYCDTCDFTRHQGTTYIFVHLFSGRRRDNDFMLCWNGHRCRMTST